MHESPQLLAAYPGLGINSVAELISYAKRNPGKLSFCFAEAEATSPWEPLSVEQGFGRGTSTVSLFPGHGPSAIVDQISRTPESLARSFAAKLRAMKTDNNVLLLKTNMGAGHGGSSGRYDLLKEVAFNYAFMLNQFGITN